MPHDKNVDTAVRQLAQRFNVSLPEHSFNQIGFLTENFIKQQLSNHKGVETKLGPPYVIANWRDIGAKRRAIFGKRIGKNKNGLTVGLGAVSIPWLGLCRSYPKHRSLLYVSTELWQAGIADRGAIAKADQDILLNHLAINLTLDHADVVIDVRELDKFVRKSKRDQQRLYVKFTGRPEFIEQLDRPFAIYNKSSQGCIRMDELSDIVSVMGEGKVGIKCDLVGEDATGDNRDDIRYLRFFTPYVQYLIVF